MFGYIKVDKSSLGGGEFGLYHSFFCGICISSKEQFGFSSRLLTNFDMTFFSILFHSFLEIDISVDIKHCITTPIRKRSIQKRTELGDKIAQANVILSYLNLLDDVVDEGRLRKRIALGVIKKHYKKAKRLFPELNDTLIADYEKLRGLEKDSCDSFDIVCHPFAHLSSRFAEVVLKEKSNEYILNLCYNLGKWVYLIDALDDLDKDYKNKNYNPFINCFGGFNSGKQFVSDNYTQLQFVFYSMLNKIAESYNDLNLGRYVCIMNNVIYKSIRDKTESIFSKYVEQGEKSESI